MPVARPVRALSPILLHIGAVEEDPAGGALIEAGEVAPEHDEVGAHRQGEGHVMVVHDAAVAADRHVDAGLLVILIARRGHLDEGGGLATSDALRLARDAD